MIIRPSFTTNGTLWSSLSINYNKNSLSLHSRRVPLYKVHKYDKRKEKHGDPPMYNYEPTTDRDYNDHRYRLSTSILRQYVYIHAWIMQYVSMCKDAWRI